MPGGNASSKQPGTQMGVIVYPVKKKSTRPHHVSVFSQYLAVRLPPLPTIAIATMITCGSFRKKI